MLELTGVASLLRGASVLYWILALVAVFLAMKFPRGRWKKAASVAGVIVLFGYLPINQYIGIRQREAFATEAWAYFKKKCEAEAREEIYKSFTDVKSVVVTKPLPPATENDLFDQFWYGDPYSSVTTGADRAVFAAAALIGTLETKGRPPVYAAHRSGFDFVESIALEGKDKAISYVKYSYPKGKAYSVTTEKISKPVSRFGISWEDISTPEDRRYWVAASRLRVIDLTDDSIVAERIGFLIESGFGSRAGQRHPWQTARGPNTTCPRVEHSFDEDRFFVQKALIPAEGAYDGK